MNILLDTHIALWYLKGDQKLSKKARAVIDDRANDIYFSIASMWEIEIKHILHLDKMICSGSDVLDLCEKADFILLPLTPDHIKSLHTLRRPKKAIPHNDPFDKILICQAKTEEMTFITHDDLLTSYNERCVTMV